jgi:hypothetical protein
MILLFLFEVSILVAACAYACAYVKHPTFGNLPEGGPLPTIETSSNHANGEFRNQTPTPVLTDDRGFLSVLIENLFMKSERLTLRLQSQP